MAENDKPGQGAEAATDTTATAAATSDGEQQSPATYSEDQVKQILAKAQESFQAQLSKQTGTLGSKIQTLQNTLNKVEEWRALDEESRAAFTDATVNAQEHADVLADKHGLTERQKGIISKGKTRAERIEIAEAMAEAKPATGTPADKDSLASMLKDLGIEVPGATGTQKTEEIARGRGVPGNPSLDQLVNKDTRGMSPQQLAEHEKLLHSAMGISTRR